MPQETPTGQPTHRFAGGTDSGPSPSISIRTRRWQTAADIIVQGTSFTAHGDVVLSLFGIPGHDEAPIVTTWQAGNNGVLHFEAQFGLVWGDAQDANGAIFVIARDEGTGNAGFARLAGGAAAWVVVVH
ncbi:MAG: hypothetical protein JWO67_2439 [Streptosporangiaceae bacterium]|jgi:hypothetical protein|nr:hypothetical protein [Streptosporangiaceae bacterium]